MPIVQEWEVAQSLGLHKLGANGLSISRGLMNWLRIKQLNTLYDRLSHLEGLAFIDAVLDHLQVKADISAADLARLPKNGPFVVVANHPLGGIDGLLLLKLLLKHNPETKVMANFLLGKIEPLAPHLCQVNPFEGRKAAFSSSAGLRAALRQLQSGHPLAIFPAGEVASRKKGWVGPIDDKAWSESALRLIQKAKVPVVPLFFKARNSDLFYFLSGIHQDLRTASLAAEVVKARNKVVPIRIGLPICVAEQQQFPDLADYTEYLRKKTFQLGYAYPKRQPLTLRPFRLKKGSAAIGTAAPREALLAAIQALDTEDTLLFSSGKFQVFFTQLAATSPILHELGHWRERTFRAVGEGSNKALDIDAYDTSYHHLILWDSKQEQLAGAYRLGIGKQLYTQGGIQGFYLSESFTFPAATHYLFEQGIEMGRALVTIPYQKKATPLFLLWRGIGQVLERYPTQQYLLGAASISSMYSPYSQSVMLAYLAQAHADPHIFGQLRPKRAFRSVLKQQDLRQLHGLGPRDVAAVDKIIQEIEPLGLQIPILIKKYLLQEAKVLGFNVDTSFNNAIDVLLCIDRKKLIPLQQTWFENRPLRS